MTDLQPLPASIRELIDAERDAGVGGDRAAIRGRILVSVGVAGAAAAAASSSAAAATAGGGGAVAAITGKVVVVMLAVGAVGGAAVLGRDDRPAAVTRRAPQTEVVRGLVAAPTPAPTPDPVATPVAVPAPEVSRPTAPARRAVAAVDDQPVLLRRAWDARARGEADTVLSIVELDAKAHPSGALAEERDALRIDALIRLSRTDDARTRAEAFVARYPDSIHRALVTRALQETP